MLKKNSKRVFVSLLTAGIVLGGIPVYAETESAAAFTAGENGSGPMGSMKQGRGGNGPMGGAMSSDSEIQSVLDENADKFEQFSFTDEETGITLEYSLYIPEGYDESEEYPLIMFIPDSTGAGKSAADIVAQYYGAAIWASDEDQEKHASFVLVRPVNGMHVFSLFEQQISRPVCCKPLCVRAVGYFCSGCAGESDVLLCDCRRR